MIMLNTIRRSAVGALVGVPFVFGHACCSLAREGIHSHVKPVFSWHAKEG